MKEFTCPVDNCDECDFHRTESWCAQAIPFREEVDDVYKANMEGFWTGLECAQRQYKWLEEHYQKFNDYISLLEEMVERSNKERTFINNEDFDKIINYWK